MRRVIFLLGLLFLSSIIHAQVAANSTEAPALFYLRNTNNPKGQAMMGSVTIGEAILITWLAFWLARPHLAPAVHKQIQTAVQQAVSAPETGGGVTVEAVKTILSIDYKTARVAGAALTAWVAQQKWSEGLTLLTDAARAYYVNPPEVHPVKADANGHL